MKICKTKKTYLKALFYILTINLCAQNDLTIKGIVLDTEKKPIEFANVVVYNIEDASIIKLEITPSTGIFEINTINHDSIKIVISHVSYKTWESGIIKKSQLPLDLKEIILDEGENTLDEIVITAEKPFIEMRPDKIVVSINKDNISLGDNAFEIMEKLPGVTVDIISGNINIQGKQGSTILINGRKTYLSTGDLATLLKNTPSDQIKSVEILTNPSAKYDASGNAGVINIIMDKNDKEGLNGSITTLYQQNKYNQFAGSLSLNFRKNNWNVYGNYTLRDSKSFTNITYEQTYLNASPALKSKQYSNRTFNIYPHNYNFGVDYETLNGFNINFLFRGSNVNVYSPQNIKTEFSDLDDNPLSSTNTKSEVNEYNQNYAFNINLFKENKDKNLSYSFDANYSFYDRNQDQSFVTTFFDENNNDTGERNLLRSEIPSLIDIWALRTDLTKTFETSKITLESGIKWSNVVNDNFPRYYDIVGNDEMLNTDLTNHFIYEESIMAGYIDFSKEFSKSTLKLGLRIEDTKGEGNQKTTNETFNRHYLEFFPTLFYNVDLTESHGLSFSFGRRIDRPSYSDLNPYRLFLDQYSSWQGNPLLNPQFSYNFELSHQYKNKIITKLSYTNTNDVIGSLIFQDDDTQITTETRSNLNKFSQINLSTSTSFKPWQWWNSNTSMSLFKNTFSGTFLDEPFKLDGIGLIISNNNSYKISEQLNGSLSFNYNSPYVSGIEKVRSSYAINLGLSRTSKDNKTIISLRFSDVFWGSRGGGTTNLANIDRTSLVRYGSRIFSFYVTYKFGKSTVPNAESRITGDEEEKNRL